MAATAFTGDNNMKEKGFRLSVLIFLGSVGLFGLFYEYAGCMAGAVIGICLLAVMTAGKKMRFFLNLDSLLFCAWILSYGFVSFYAIDRGMAFLGFLKILSVLFFTVLAMQMDSAQRRRMLTMIPWSASVMVVLGLAGYFVRPLHHFFFKAGRLGGFFQYANVFALFCLLGILIEAEEEIHYRHYAHMVLLSLGIALSGSRTVFLMAVAVFLLLAVKEKRHRLVFLAAAVLMTGGMGVYVVLTGDVGKVGRIYSSFVSSSALRRVLYLKDGLGLLSEHPFGLGYLGYYLIQPSVQTGVYSARFVHSDWLQTALDAGVLPCAAFMAVLVRSFLSKRTGFYGKLLIAAVGLHCAVDFDLEFTVMLFVLALNVDLYYGKEITVSRGKNMVFCKAGIVGLSLGMLYCGTAMSFYSMGNPETAARLLPIYSEAKAVVLQNDEDMEQARELAEDLAVHSPYIAAAHDILALAAYEDGDYRKMAEEKEKSVDLQRYNIEAYNRYVILLSRGIEAASAQGDEETLIELLRYVAEVPDKIQKIRRETDPLAYRIKKKPDFELEDEVQGYIDQVVEILYEPQFQGLTFK
jgi:hypothetical protein